MALPKKRTPSEAGIAVFEKIANAIGLRDQDRTAILGGPESRLDRMVMFLAIYDLAGDLVGDPCAWLTAPNKGELFRGKQPIDFILDDPGKNLHTTLQHLQGAFGGWA